MNHKAFSLLTLSLLCTSFSISTSAMDRPLAIEAAPTAPNVLLEHQHPSMSQIEIAPTPTAIPTNRVEESPSNALPTISEVSFTSPVMQNMEHQGRSTVVTFVSYKLSYGERTGEIETTNQTFPHSLIETMPSVPVGAPWQDNDYSYQKMQHTEVWERTGSDNERYEVVVDEDVRKTPLPKPAPSAPVVPPPVAAAQPVYTNLGAEIHWFHNRHSNFGHPIGSRF